MMYIVVRMSIFIAMCNFKKKIKAHVIHQGIKIALLDGNFT